MPFVTWFRKKLKLRKKRNALQIARRHRQRKNLTAIGELETEAKIVTQVGLLDKDREPDVEPERIETNEY